MKKLVWLCALLLSGVIFPGGLKAQSLKDLFSKEAVSGVVDDLLGKKKEMDLNGTWDFESSACEFKTENLLKKAGGAVAALAVEGKLDEYYAKIGIVPGKFSYTFKADSTFVNSYGGRNFTGTYSVDKANGRIKFTYLKIFRFTAKLEQSGQKVSLLFDADMLLKLFSAISSKSSSAGLKMIGNLADEYDGMMLGFKLKKK